MTPELGKPFGDIQVVDGFITLPYLVSEKDAKKIVDVIIRSGNGQAKCDPVKVIRDPDVTTEAAARAVAYHIIWCD